LRNVLCQSQVRLRNRLWILSQHCLPRDTQKHESAHKSCAGFPMARHRSNILGFT
jgi:hypothetical protein